MSATVPTIPPGMLRSDLENAVYGWLHRANFVSPVPNFDPVGTFVALAEEDINMDLRARCMVQRFTQVADGQYLQLPCDYLEAQDVRLSTGRELQYRPRTEMGNLLQAGTQGVWPQPWPLGVPMYPWATPPYGPCFYSIVGSQMEIWPYQAPPDPPPPDYQPWTIELAYYQQQQLGPDDSDTTVVLQQLPGTYLWGALTHSAPFVRNDERVATWKGAYQSAISRANLAHERARQAGGRIVARYRSMG